MLASPWTMNLCALLKAALGDIDEQDPFAVVLKERLGNRGTELLDQVGTSVCIPLAGIDDQWCSRRSLKLSVWKDRRRPQVQKRYAELG